MDLQKVLKKIVTEINKKNYNQVIKECEKLIDLKINNTEIYNFYGLALQKIGLLEESIEYLLKSIQLSKNNFVAMNNLAVTYKGLGKFKMSENLYKKCLELKSDYLVGILNFANLKQETNRFNESIKLFQEAQKLSPRTNDLYIFTKLCNLNQIIGNIEEAKNYAEKIIKFNPNIPTGYILISKFIDHKENMDCIHKMENLLKSNFIKEDELIDLFFTLGNAYESIKNYQIALTYFKKGNDLRRKSINFDLIDFTNLSKNIIKFFKNFNFKKIKKNDFEKKIIFICGMPRSGTSLVEHIISSHNQVTATGENIFFSNEIKKNFLNNLKFDEKKIDHHLSSKKNFLQENFLKFLDEYNFKGNTLTDKTVQNFLWIGFIKIYFPNSKIIFTRRNPKDVCLSIFKTDFVNGFMNFSYSENHIVEFYNCYKELEIFWKELLKDELYTIEYEALINDTHKQIKDLINFCDLDWDENCLKHYNNKSPVTTASINQVRKPIYSSSINLFKKYSSYLDRNFENLKED